MGIPQEVHQAQVTVGFPEGQEVTAPGGGMPLLGTDLVPEAGCVFTKSLGNLMLVASARNEVIF